MPRKKAHLKSQRLWASVVMCVTLSACNNPFRYIAPDSSDIQMRHMARPGEMADLHPLYCYQTLGDPQCYMQPLKQQDQRLSGYYGPHPTHMDPYYDKARLHTSNEEDDSPPTCGTRSK